MTDLTLIEEVQQRGLSLIDLAGRVDVVDTTSADDAGRLLMQVKKAIGDIEDARKKVTKPLDDAKKAAMEQARSAQQPYKEAQQAIEGALLGWTMAERKRIAEENARAESERAALENEAQRAAEEGRLDDAAALQMQRDATGTVEKVHRAAGTQARFTWQAEVTDLDLLVKAVAENAMLPSNLLTPNQSALNAYARATAGKAKVPGLRFVEKAGLAATGRA